MSKSPVPQGKYIPASRNNNLVYTAGMTPRDNRVLKYSGKVKLSESIGTYKDAVRLATANALTAALNILSDSEFIDKILSLTVYIAAEEGYQKHSNLADFASDYLYERLGNRGVGSRAAIGVSSLPQNATFEIQLVASIGKQY